MARSAKGFMLGIVMAVLAVCVSCVLIHWGGIDVAWADEVQTDAVQTEAAEPEGEGAQGAADALEIEAADGQEEPEGLSGEDKVNVITIKHSGKAFTVYGEAPLEDVLSALGVEVGPSAVTATSSLVEITTVDGIPYVIALSDGVAYLNVSGEGASIDDAQAAVEEPEALRAARDEGADEPEVDPHQKAREDNEALGDAAIVVVNERADSWSFTDEAWVEFRNESQTDDVFYIWYDGEWLEEGICLDPGLPAPADGWYEMHADWNGEYFEVWFDTRDAPVHWSQVDTGQGCQRVGGSWLEAKPKIRISKESTCPEISAAVAGAQYAVFYYQWQAAELRDPMYILTIEDGGWSDVLRVSEPGNWYLREWSAPEGFILDPTVYVVNIAPTGVAEANFRDAPINDPNTIRIEKQISNPDSDGSMGASTLALAEYTFEYYAADYESIEEAQASGAPTRTWVMRTNAKGLTAIDFGNNSFEYNGETYSYKVSGDEFFTDQFGMVTMPLGTIVVHETKAPEGFELSNEVFFARLVADSTSDRGFKWIGEKVMVDPQDPTATVAAGEVQKRYGVEIYKEIQGVADETSPAGIQFEIVSETTGEVVATLTLDEEGKASTTEDALVYDTYIIREVESTLPVAETGEYLIQPFSETSGTGSNIIATIDLAAHEALEVIHVDCVDYASEPGTGKKLDSETKEGVPETEFTIWKLSGTTMTDGAVNEDETAVSSDDENWEVYKVVWSDNNGDFDFGWLPYGIYKVDETATNIAYMTSAESAGLLPGTDMARIFKLDKNNPYVEQEWLNARIKLECNVDKSTIEVTSAGLEYKTSSEGGETVSNVGVEKYAYEVAFDNGDTEITADEYWVVDQMNFVDEPYGLRMTDLWLPVVVNDLDGKVWLLWKTNRSDAAGNVPEGMTFAQPELVPGSACDGTMRFDAAGWMLIGQYAADEATQIDLASMLSDGEYITELALCYGAVAPGFSTIEGAPLTYLVSATHTLPVGTVIPNTAESHISRNWTKTVHTPDGDVELEEPFGLTDDDEDSVETRVVDTFVQEWTPYVVRGGYGASGYRLPQTGDGGSLGVVASMLFAVFGMLGMIVSRRKINQG